MRRDVTVPPDLAEAIEGDWVARWFFEALTPVGKRRLVLAVEAGDGNRRGRIEATVARLREGDILR